MESSTRFDNYFIGIAIGIVLASAMLGILLWTISITDSPPYWLNKPHSPYLMALIPNIIAFRTFMVNFKAEKTGKGILIVSFIMMIAVFLFVGK
jgi:hypothetical protein